MKTNIVFIITLAAAAAMLPSCTSTGTGADAATVGVSGVKRYPLKTCIVSDNELGSMGPVITKIYQGQEVKFCCKPCVKEFDENPQKFLAKLPR